MLKIIIKGGCKLKVSTRFSDAIHILAFIEFYSGKIVLSSENIAGSVKLSSVVVRKLMSTLKKAGLLATKSGSVPNPKLTRPAQDISLLDIYLAVEKNKPLFEVDKETNSKCVIGKNIQQILTKYYTEAENAAFAKLNSISLEDVVNNIVVSQAEQKMLNDIKP